ncbi:hypothetical protein AYK26_06210 [Euryarchaeota archaeon SM23-78]|nr:MAG: hypothetical protein AYK26_06210 [Euryarchaeota archaeon SM23-78]MBW3001220.1 hypothetical protein [Candidatus Woesearchaeota archaeon]
MNPRKGKKTKEKTQTEIIIQLLKYMHSHSLGADDVISILKKHQASRLEKIKKLSDLSRTEFLGEIYEHADLETIAKKYQVKTSTVQHHSYKADIFLKTEIDKAKVIKALERIGIVPVLQLLNYLNLKKLNPEDLFQSLEKPPIVKPPLKKPVIVKLPKSKKFSNLSKTELLEEIYEHANLETIAKKYGVKTSTVQQQSYKIGIPIAKEITKAKIIQRVRGEEIKPLRGLLNYLEKNNLNLNDLLDTLEKEIISRLSKQGLMALKIKEAIDKGLDSVKSIGKDVGLSYGTVKKIAKKYDIELPKRAKKRRPELDVLIEQGLTLEKIGNEVGLTKERVRQYIESRELYEFWNKKKAETKARARTQTIKYNREQLYLCFFRRMFQLAKQEGWAVEKALEHCFSTRGRGNIFEEKYAKLNRFINLFSDYEQASKNKKKIGFQTLADKHGFKHGSYVRHLIVTAGGKSLCWDVKETKKLMKKAFKLDMSSGDIAYFTKKSPGSVNATLCRIGKRKRKTRYLKMINPRIHGKHNLLGYRHASQVYEALHAGFDKKEIPELLELEPVLVCYAIDNRKEIEEKIIHGLNVLYPNKKHEHPFLV